MGMAEGNPNIKLKLKLKLGRCMCVLIAIAYMLSHEFVQGRKIAPVKNTEFVRHKGTVKTIKSEDGDLIDCVDIYRQPAFNHPLLKNHTIQMKPSSYPSGTKLLSSQAKIFQSWLKNGQCPEGTVPIRRTQKHDEHRAIPLSRHRKQLNHSLESALASSHEYAQVSAIGNKYYGAHASVNVWNPKTENGEFSLAQFWVLSGTAENLNSVEAGWMVNPGMYHDNQTRFFLYWTSDNYQSTGCYNLNCPGFVQTSQKFAMGSSIKPVSEYNAQQYDIAITIHKDSGNWWLQLQDEIIGYWPGSIFTGLSDSASTISWGGEVFNTNSEGHHTSTQMGSGHFPNEGPGKSSYFRNLGVMDDPNSNTLRDPENLQPYVTNPSSYDLHVAEIKSDNYGTYFYYGGPGY